MAVKKDLFFLSPIWYVHKGLWVLTETRVSDLWDQKRQQTGGKINKSYSFSRNSIASLEFLGHYGNKDAKKSTSF